MMLQSIREKSQGWILWVIVIVICVPFALWGVKSYLYGSSAGNVVVKVDGMKITEQQLSISYNQLKRQQQLQLASNNSSSKQSNAALKQIALQSIISSTVLNKAAVSGGFRVGSGLVEAALAKMPIFQANGIFSRARFQQFINGMLYTVDGFLDQLRSSILANQVESGIRETVFVLPNEVNQAIQLIKQQRTFNYLTIPSSRFLNKVSLPPNAAKNYYKKNLDDFKVPEKVSIQYLQLSIVDLMKKINPTKQQLQQFYSNNIGTYTQSKQWKVAHILIAVSTDATKKEIAAAQKKADELVKKLKQNPDFVNLAKQYSDDTNTATKGGELPWLTAAQLGPGFQGALKRLNKVGDISVPIKTRHGFEFLKLINTKPKKVLPYEKVKDKVAQAYKQRQAEKKFADLSEQLANVTYESPNSLKQAAKQLSLPIHTTDLFTKEGGNQGITKNPKIVNAAFGDEVLNQTNNSDPINLNDNSVVVLRINKHIPSSVKSFKSVKSQITDKLHTQAAVQQAKVLGDQIIAAINQGRSPRYVARKNRLKLKWNNVAHVSRKDKSINAEVLVAAFHASPPTKHGVTTNVGVELSSGDYAIVSLISVKNGNAKKVSAAQKNNLKDNMEHNAGSLEYQLYVAGLMQKAKIIHTKKNAEE